MFDSLISLLIVIALILYILDYIGVIEIVSAFVSLIVGAIGLTVKLLVWLYRYFFGASSAKSQGPDQLRSLSAVWRGRGGRMRSAGSRRPQSD
jgi:UPF0716 family protein affecting phage T7 exclusion